ncbi:hypothetical protein MRX96_015826 [Rhipicephalus microplus]
MSGFSIRTAPVARTCTSYSLREAMHSLQSPHGGNPGDATPGRSYRRSSIVFPFNFTPRMSSRRWIHATRMHAAVFPLIGRPNDAGTAATISTCEYPITRLHCERVAILLF